MENRIPDTIHLTALLRAHHLRCADASVPHLKWLLAALVFLVASPATACMQCNYAILWDQSPGAIWWIYGGIAWYISLWTLAKISKTKLPYIGQGYLYGPGAIVALFASDYLMFLFLPVMACLPVAAISSARVLLSPKTFPKPIISRVLLIGVATILVSAAGAMWEVRRAGNLDTAEKIVKWSGTVMERRWLSQLGKGEPASVEQYRKLLRIAPCTYAASKAAERLAEIGTTSTDTLLILRAAESCEAGPDQYVVARYVEPLSKMTRTKLKDDESPAIWRQKIEAAGALQTK